MVSGRKSVAYFSDASGEYALHVAPQNGRGEPRRYELDGSGFYHNPRWSPDSKKISYWDNSLAVYWIDLESGAVEKVDAEYRYSPIRFFHHRWAPDSKWITYTLDTKAYVQKVYVYSLEEKKSYEITDGLSEASEPVFDPSGKYLYFFASTDAGPVKHWFAMSNADVDMTQGLYVAVLGKDTPSPLAKQSDEETGESDDGETQASDEASGVDVTIDFERLHERILTIPVMSSLMTNLQVGSEGELYYLRDAAFGRTGDSKRVNLHRYKLSEREEETLTSGVAEYQLTPDGRKLLYRSRRLGHRCVRGQNRAGQRKAADRGPRSRSERAREELATELRSPGLSGARAQGRTIEPVHVLLSRHLAMDWYRTRDCARRSGRPCPGAEDRVCLSRHRGWHPPSGAFQRC